MHCSCPHSSSRSLSAPTPSPAAADVGSSSLGESQEECLQTWQPEGESSSGNRFRSELDAEIVQNKIYNRNFVIVCNA